MSKVTLEYRFYKVSVLTFLMMISAINYNVFINPSKIVAGGVNGISIIIENIFKINPSITIFGVSFLILFVGLIFSEYELVLSALYTSIIYPVFVYITSTLNGIVAVTNSDMVIISIFSGIVSGIVSGITCKLNTSQGGILLIAQLINKKLKLSVSSLNILFNFIIVLMGGFSLGINGVLYAIIFILSNKIIMEKVMLGISKTKLFQIITSKEEETIDFITKELGIQYTIFDVQSAKNQKDKKMIMVLISTRDYFKLKEEIKKIDSNAFISITDAFESMISK